MPATDQRQRGFNLIELLVVMAIIVIIVTALTLPGIWKAYDKAQQLVAGAAGTGITGEYYSGSSRNGGIFNTLILSRLDDTIQMTESSRPSGVPNDHYSVKWIGLFRAGDEGAYNFYPRTDDGVDFFINGQKVVSDISNAHGMREFTATETLEAGQMITIEMNFQEFGGGSGAELRISGPNMTKAIAETEVLFPAGTAADSIVTIEQYNNKLNSAADRAKNVRYHR
jgi:prepilin-type N-terminal cleavage/methylation domain-containing protein